LIGKVIIPSLWVLWFWCNIWGAMVWRWWAEKHERVDKLNHNFTGSHNRGFFLPAEGDQQSKVGCGFREEGRLRAEWQACI
jgi:hypothetical protein